MDQLQHCYHMMRFMKDSINGDATFTYEEDLDNLLESLKNISAIDEDPCYHSFYEHNCPSCENRMKYLAMLDDAKRILGHSDVN